MDWNNRHSDEIIAVVKNGEKTHFPLGNIYHPDNFILRLINWENIDENGLIIDGKLGLLLSALIESHKDYPKEDKVEALQDNPELSRAHYLSGINLTSASVILL